MSSPGILLNSKTIAVVGYSLNQSRPSNRISRYLKLNGYEVYGINPNIIENEIEGIICLGSLCKIPVKISIVNAFRRSEYLPGIVKEAVDLAVKPDLIWTQLGVINAEAKELALKNKIEFVENKCIMTEHQKLLFKN